MKSDKVLPMVEGLEEENSSTILVADDEPINRALIQRRLERAGYRSARMNSLDFETDPGNWHFVKVDSRGLRDYSEVA